MHVGLYRMWYLFCVSFQVFTHRLICGLHTMNCLYVWIAKVVEFYVNRHIINFESERNNSLRCAICLDNVALVRLDFSRK